MKIIQLDQCPSTQKLLQEELSKNKNGSFSPILINSQAQTEGRGRGERSWTHYPAGLAFSFTLSPSPELTLSSAEISVLISKFFKNKFQCSIEMKWPNDLMNTEKKKVGGILISYHDANHLIVGVGININDQVEDFTYPADSLNLNSLPGGYKTDLPVEIYQWILQNRLEPKEIIDQWQTLCCHRKQVVTLIESQQEYTGLFLGMGPRGEALLEIEGRPTPFLNGSLRI